MCFMCGTPLIYSRDDLTTVQDHLEVVHDVKIEYGIVEERLLKLGLLGPMESVHNPSNYPHGVCGRVLST